MRLCSLALGALSIALGLGACDSGSQADPTAAASAGAGAAGAGGAGGEGGTVTPDPWSAPHPWSPDAAYECPVPTGPNDRVTEALAELDLDRTLGIPTSLFLGAGGNLASDPARRSFFHQLEENPFEIPCFSGNLAARVDAAVASDHPLTALVADAAASLDLTLTVGGAFPEPEASPLVGALKAAFGAEPWDEVAAVAALADVPDDVERAAAKVLFGALEAKALRDAGLGTMVSSGVLPTVYKKGASSWLVGSGTGLNPDVKGYSGLFRAEPEGAGKLYEGAARLAQACDEARFADLAPDGAPFEFFVKTPLGAILLRGGADDVYDPSLDARLAEPLLLVVDTGGDDTYRIPAGATTSWNHAIAVHVDRSGDDRYGYVEVPSDRDDPGLLPSDADGRYAGDDNYGHLSLSKTARQGAGILGYGYLLDLGGGDDEYRSHRMSQGFGNFGVGILWDDGGKDRYEAENGAQGSGIVGLGLLHDGGGDDVYRSFGSSQGFGWVLSVGTLHDSSGDDRYEMVVDQPVILFSPQTPGYANSSLGQGVAFGWRRDATGTHLAGGIGLLRDGAGNDRYDGAVFVQGTGYWMGLGVLADASGHDRYNGLFYAQGAGAHFALGAFLEGGGDDQYNVDHPAQASSIGLAHDFSVTFFVEDGGADHYVGPDRSVGAAKCHGLSLFVENGGDDRYDTHDRAVGYATDYDWAPGSCGDSTTVPTYALFVDAAGNDTYTKPMTPPNVNDSTWVNDDPDDADARELSAGIDASTGNSYVSAYGSEHRGKR